MTTPHTTPADAATVPGSASPCAGAPDVRGRGDLRIDRCVCHDVTFSEVVQWSRSSGSRSVDCAAKALGCTQGCGLCLPYVERALRTGETVFSEIIAHPGAQGTASR